MDTLAIEGRVFMIWEYSVSHAQLLLRSVRNAENSTRIDVLFKNVKYLSLRTRFELESIEQVSHVHPMLADAGAKDALRNGQVGFVLRSDLWNGLVVASTMIWAEDELEHYEPSALPIWPMGAA